MVTMNHYEGVIDQSIPRAPVGTAHSGAVASGSLIGQRHRDRDFALRRILLIADMAAIATAMAVTMSMHGSLDALTWMLLTLPAWAFLFRMYDLYLRPIRRFEPTYLGDASSLFHALLVGTVLLWGFAELAPVRSLSFGQAAGFGLIAFLAIGLARVTVRRVNLRLSGPERVFIVAPPEDVRVLDRKFRNHPEYEMVLVGAATPGAEGLGMELSAELEEIDSVLASGEVDHLIVQLDATFIPQEEVVKMMRACFRRGVRFGAFPNAKTLLLPGVEVNHIEGRGILTYQRPVLSRSSRLMKRGLDLALSTIMLVVLAPLLALIALAISIDSRGPVIFRQTRVGRDNKRFRLFKFRTMVDGADEMADELMQMSQTPEWLLLENDPRRTRVGRFLRLTSLDELPQLWNVIRGEMSLVGPRPLPERDDESVRDWGRHRLDLQPGLTGHWQVLGRNTIPFREMVEIDYAYVASWSLLGDLRLLVQTVPTVLFRRGAN